MRMAEELIVAGVSKRDITADVDRALVHDPLYARMLALGWGGALYAVVALDAVGIGWICDIPNDFLARLRKETALRCGMPEGHVLVCATHSHPSVPVHHCGPDELVARCAEGVAEAVGSMVPVVASSGRVMEDRLTVNRTLRLNDGRHWTIRHANPCPPDGLVEALGPLDGAVGALRLDRADGGGALAVLFNFACHPLWADAHGRISANYPGIACDVVERNMPGCMAIFLQGCASDVIDLGFKDFEAEREAFGRNMGNQLGLDALDAARGAAADMSMQDIGFCSETARLPRRLDIPEQLDSLDRDERALCARLRTCALNFRSFLPLYLKYSLNGSFPLGYPYKYLAEEKAGRSSLRDMDDINRANIAKYLENIGIMEELARIADRRETFKFHQELNAGREDVGAEICALRIADFVIVTSPTEMLTQVGLDIKGASPFRNTYVAAYCNGYLHYGAPGEYYGHGGYEVTECMLAPGWEKVHRDVAARLLARLHGELLSHSGGLR